MTSELCEFTRKVFRNLSLSLKNDVQGGDLFNDLFCCE